MMNRELQIVCYGPSAGAGRGYIMGPPVVVDAAHRSNEANFTGPHGRLGPSTGSLAWLWARTETHAHPTAPNEPNFRVLDAKTKVLMRNQGKRRAQPALRNGRREAGSRR